MTTMIPFEYPQWLDLEAGKIQLKPDAPPEVVKAFEEWRKLYRDPNKIILS